MSCRHRHQSHSGAVRRVGEDQYIPRGPGHFTASFRCCLFFLEWWMRMRKCNKRRHPVPISAPSVLNVRATRITVRGKRKIQRTCSSSLTVSTLWTRRTAPRSRRTTRWKSWATSTVASSPAKRTTETLNFSQGIKLNLWIVDTRAFNLKLIFFHYYHDYSVSKENLFLLIYSYCNKF